MKTRDELLTSLDTWNRYDKRAAVLISEAGYALAPLEPEQFSAAAN